MNGELQCTPMFVLVYLIKRPNFVIVFFPKKKSCNMWHVTAIYMGMLGFFDGRGKMSKTMLT